MTTNGALTTLAGFGGSSGTQPDSTLELGVDGQLYGTTMYGGQSTFAGTIFKSTTNGGLATLFYFGGTNGVNPKAPTLGLDGNFYGVTGINDNQNTNAGSIFELKLDGAFTNLFSFGYANTNVAGLSTNNIGFCPNKLTQAPDGSFYGTTFGGNTNGYGITFKLALIPPPAIPLNSRSSPGQIILAWTNSFFILQSAPEAVGTFTNIDNATSPFTNSIVGSRKFYRLIAY
jgi:uncharacterized repeat protein (TIGR03803 family)